MKRLSGRFVVPGTYDPRGVAHTIDLDYDSMTDDEKRVTLLIAGINDLRPFWPRVRHLFVGWMGRQFDTQGAFFADPWEPLSPAYLAWKTRVYPGKRILSAEGDLRRSATSPKTVTASARELVLRIVPYTKRTSRAGRTNLKLGTARLATNIPTRSSSARTIDPAWFQIGTTSMPARPLIADVPPFAQAELEREAEDYIEDLARRVGLL